ncbi:MAG: hypothetical protein V2B18_03275 [Pseudomonadota bacterium]
MTGARQLKVPMHVPEDFAQSVTTILILGFGGTGAWDVILVHPPGSALGWIRDILRMNEMEGLVHPEIEWWERQIQGH